MISLKNKKYKEIEITEIKSLGILPTFDIEIKNNHHYLTKNNIVTHNSSIFSNIVSGGCEPIFLPEFVRTVIVNGMPEHISHCTPKWYEGEWYETEMFKFHKEGTDEMLRGVDEFGVVYKIDKNRGLTKEVLCEDYGVRYLKNIGEWNNDAEWAVTTSNLTVDDHIIDLKGFAKWIDSAISKCIVKGTFINTNKGIIKIEDFSDNNIEDNFVDISDQNYYVIDENGDKQKILSHYNGGIKPCYELQFNNGYKIGASINHKLLTENGWKRFEDINVGDKIFYRNDKNYDECTYLKVKQPNVSNLQKNVKIHNFPQYWDENLALFIGMWLSDGYVNKHGIGICEKNNDVGILVKDLFNTLFNINSLLYIDKRTNVKTHVFNSVYISKYFKEEFGYNSINKKIPKEILLSNKSVQLSFIKGLTLDGYISTNKLIIYDGYSKNIVNCVAEIVQRLGYRYYIGNRIVKNGKLSKISYSIGVYLDEFSEIFAIETHKNNYRKIGYGAIQRYISKENHNKLLESIPKTVEGSWRRRNIRNSLNKDCFVMENTLKNINWELYDNNLECVVVTKKEFIGEQQVYDIEVENTHSYLIGGIISHNTICVPFEYPYEDFKKIYFDAWETGYIKGITTYRSGTMMSVLSAKAESGNGYEEIIQESVKLPDSQNAILKTIRSEGRKWYLTITMDELNIQPIALFVHTNHPEKNATTHDAVDKLITLARNKNIPEQWIEDTIKKMENDNNTTKIAKAIGLNLRHGVHIKNVVSTLDTVETTVNTFLFQIRKFLAQFIKDGEKVVGQVCDSCGSSNLVYREGCMICVNCGSSKCG